MSKHTQGLAYGKLHTREWPKPNIEGPSLIVGIVAGEGGAEFARVEALHTTAVADALTRKYAELFSLAPEMLAALRELLWLADDHEWEDREDPALVTARALLSRLDGAK